MKIVSNDKWTWYQLDINEINKITEVIKKYQYPEYEGFLRKIEKKNSSHIQVNVIDGDREIIYGSLMYHKHSFKQKDYNSFHFYITNEFIMTVNLDLSLLEETNHKQMIERMQSLSSPGESFFVLLGEIMKKHLKGFNQFEEDFRELLWEVRQDNNVNVLDKVHKSRYKLLVWTNLIISVEEVLLGIEEAFHEKITERIEYKRILKKTEVNLMLTEQYRKEFDTLIKLEEVVSSHRGNKIMKALTLLTAISTPLTAFGALWGMNFKNMPELEWKYGYLYVIILIIISTVGIYFYLRMKGWTGDLLKGKKKNSFFK
ncbi:magnesium transporter CorA family protein [Priestia megaterium]|jgi:magnesium transporter|uniref:magnesium transporter CorA family protein n=1 Tax=Priestia megaterium TaxID=1404 RepID=UPI001A94B78E|nr:magnesium transporter CorA family protein [Priestia megaterium]MBU8590060.1 magnesium transporter CorA family protein [Priestia megaterium]QSX23684.1 magnesium transporter CorA family protein [Priestia megaterium]